MGLYFLTKITVKGVEEKGVFAIFGIGEKKGSFPFSDIVRLDDEFLGYQGTGMSGCHYYKLAHTTMSNWCSLVSPLLIPSERVETEKLPKEPIELSEIEKKVFFEELDKKKVRLLCLLVKSGILSTTNDFGIWTHLKPLIKTYESFTMYPLPLGAELHFEAYSFRATFVINNFRLRVTKGRVKHFVYKNFVEVTLGIAETQKIWYNRTLDKITVYYSNPRLRSMVMCYEVYKEHRHPEALIDYHLFLDIINFLFAKRLGDLMFLEEHELVFVNNATKTRMGRELEFPSDLGKMKVLQGTLDKAKLGDRDIFVVQSEEDIILYHPEHGTLTLPPEKYYIVSVPYWERGHD